MRKEIQNAIDQNDYTASRQCEIEIESQLIIDIELNINVSIMQNKG